MLEERDRLRELLSKKNWELMIWEALSLLQKMLKKSMKKPGKGALEKKTKGVAAQPFAKTSEGSTV